ncbi:1-phosphofructokinase [Vibrio ostreicida]|uniref:Phosphofructokinase n=1 Tax=Vibrio ostreicida TaxID=526588 RepID=A0ABT8BWY5_9VIBR|nr:1-phosphofructokinase [Vibrio ostreicida]MDN3611681.1 1-phosphofructokinase [Vibrio ostreicida]NPD10121.1 1-phosphofructokinase [Vibrio ostreicida]
MSNKVVTITLNPALDLTGGLDTLKPGKVNLIKQSSLHAAGKGINVARVLSDLGAKVTVTGFLGQENQQLFCQLFTQINAIDAFVRVDGATRINVKLIENDDRVSDINFPGMTISEQAIQQFESTLKTLCVDHQYFVMAGSLPAGVSPQRCASWVSYLQKRGKQVLFDSSQDALKAGIQASPWLVKPNEDELAAFVGSPILSTRECQVAAQAIAQAGVDNVVVSLGPKGVMWLNNHEWIHAQPPTIEVVSTVGAGDTLVAGLCWGHMQAMPKNTLITFAAALSALAVAQIGVGVTDINQVTRLQKKINITQLCDKQE